MGVDLQLYRLRIGTFGRMKNKNQRKDGLKIPVQIWIALIIAVLLIIGGVEPNPGPADLNQISDMLKAMTKDLADVKKMGTEMGAKLDANTEQLGRIIKELKEDTEQKFAEYRKTIEKIKKNCENGQRKLNLILFGVKEDLNRRLYEIVAEILERRLEIPLQGWEIVETYRLGKKGRGTRPILLKVSTQELKWRIISSAKKLKGSGIYIERDYSDEEQRYKKSLLIKMKEARNEGKKAYLKGLNLFVNNERWSIHVRRDEQRKPDMQQDEIQTADRSTTEAFQRRVSGEITSDDAAPRADDVREGAVTHSVSDVVSAEPASEVCVSVQQTQQTVPSGGEVFYVKDMAEAQKIVKERKLQVIATGEGSILQISGNPGPSTSDGGGVRVTRGRKVEIMKQKGSESRI